MDFLENIQLRLKDISSTADRISHSHSHPIDNDLIKKQTIELYEYLIKEPWNQSSDKSARRSTSSLSLPKTVPPRTNLSPSADIQNEAEVISDSNHSKDPEVSELNIESEPDTHHQTAHESKPVDEIVIPKSSVPVDIIPNQSLHERFSQAGESKSINDQFSQKQSPMLADRLKNTSIKNLNSSIALNERISYIRHLFKGDEKAFSDFIQVVQNAGDMDTAFSLFNQAIIADAGISPEDSTALSLLGLIRRLYI